MIELRPALAPGEAPLLLGGPLRSRRPAPVRPLIRSAVVAVILSAALGLPAIRMQAASLPLRLERGETRAPGASAQKDTARVATVREASR